MAEAGDCRERSFERNLRRNLYGTKPDIDFHGSVVFAFVKTPWGRSAQELDSCIARPFADPRAHHYRRGRMIEESSPDEVKT